MAFLSDINDTIFAMATPPGVGAIGVIRVSGTDSFSILNRLFPSKDLTKQPSHSLQVGYLKEEQIVLDEVVLALYKSPHSYTGEDVIEISCHGSAYIQQRIMDALVQAGARMALPGEFTQRAFLNGKMDLAQAESVADVIAANSEAAQQAALKQLKGGFSGELKKLREELIHFAALMELELDFSQEDVVFADRTALRQLIDRLFFSTHSLLDSFRLGNVIKNGVSVAIIGKPNAGKSTLLNALLNEDRAIVSDIPGTTRDTIEEALNIKGVLFRLIDTAGVRNHASDAIEQLGIERSRLNASKADLIIYLRDITEEDSIPITWLKPYSNKVVEVFNKSDVGAGNSTLQHNMVVPAIAEGIYISAKDKKGIENLKQIMFDKAVGGALNTENTLVTNTRHVAALQKVTEALTDIKKGMDENLSGDLLTPDIHRALHYLGEITGEVEVDRDILGAIFSKFCIGK